MHPEMIILNTLYRNDKAKILDQSSMGYLDISDDHQIGTSCVIYLGVWPYRESEERYQTQL